jgi:hypothetical protein
MLARNQFDVSRERLISHSCDVRNEASLGSCPFLQCDAATIRLQINNLPAHLRSRKIVPAAMGHSGTAIAAWQLGTWERTGHEKTSA